MFNTSKRSPVNVMHDKDDEDLSMIYITSFYKIREIRCQILLI